MLIRQNILKRIFWNKGMKNRVKHMTIYTLVMTGFGLISEEVSYRSQNLIICALIYVSLDINTKKNINIFDTDK